MQTVVPLLATAFCRITGTGQDPRPIFQAITVMLIQSYLCRFINLHLGHGTINTFMRLRLRTEEKARYYIHGRCEK
jgi:hypothetical protein